MDLADFIDRNAGFAPDKPAIRFEGATLSYAALSQRIEAMARALKSRLGVGRGDRVGLIALNHPDYLVALYASARLGAMLVPINWRLAAAEQVFILRDASVKALLLQQAFAGVIEPLAQALPGARMVGLDFVPAGGAALENLLAVGTGEARNPHVDLSHPLLIVYTSGTTGRPKGAVLRQEAIVANAVMSQHMHDTTSADHILTALPMFHVGGLNIQTTPALQQGAMVTLHARFFADDVLASIAADRPSMLVMVPSALQALIEHPAWATTDVSSLRVLNTGSTQVPRPLIEAFVDRGVPVVQTYGATETAPIAVYSRVSGDWHRFDAAGLGSTGLPGLCCEAKVVDADMVEVAHGTPGEVVVRGANVFFEYWGNAEATAESLVDGWYRSGDIATRDADGYFFIHDRKKNMIISGGENIYPAEVERVLLSHPAIAEAAVVGRSDPRWQEVPVGCIVLRDGLRASAQEIEAHCLTELARFKVPRHYVFMDVLPRNVMGKVQHFILKELITS